MRQLTKYITALIISVGLIYFFYNQKNKSQEIQNTTTQTKTNQTPQLSNQNSGPVVSADSTSANSTSSNFSEEQKDPALIRFQNWIKIESQNLNQPHVDTKSKDLELKKLVENFSEKEKEIILQTALNIKYTANERILAAYLLVLDQSSASSDRLNLLAQKALPDFGPANPHTEAETRRGQELAVRYMAVDELFKRVQINPEAIETLQKLANNAESAEIRSYVQRKLKEIR